LYLVASNPGSRSKSAIFFDKKSIRVYRISKKIIYPFLQKLLPKALVLQEL